VIDIGAMETLELLGVALGMASLAGINLYLTVFVTGLAVRLQWISLAPQYESLAILADPIVIALAGTFFVLEFFADKIPWVDTLWDGVHTFIRPVGAAFLAILVLGDPDPVFGVVIALLAGGTALTSHAVKATGRIVVNASPEPLSNIGMSLAEDGLVLAGLGLLWWNPVVGLLVVVLLLSAVGFFAVRLLRCLRTRIFFAWKKLNAPAQCKNPGKPEFQIPVEVDCLLHQESPGEIQLLWALPAVSAKIPKFPPHLRGWLMAVKSDAHTQLFWAGRVHFRTQLVSLRLEGSRLHYERGFLFDAASLIVGKERPHAAVFFDRSVREYGEKLLVQLVQQTTPLADSGTAKTEKIPATV